MQLQQRTAARKSSASPEEASVAASQLRAMGSGSSSIVKPFDGESRSGSERELPLVHASFRNSQHLSRSNTVSREADEACDPPSERSKNVKEIDQANMPLQRQEIAWSNRPSTGHRQDSEKNPFEIETEAPASASLTGVSAHPWRRGSRAVEGRASAENRQPGTWPHAESFAAHAGMAWNGRQTICFDVDGLSGKTKQISRSRLSYEDSCDEETEPELETEAAVGADPRLLTSGSLSEIDRLLYSDAEAEARTHAEASVASVNRKRGQSVAGVSQARHVSFISLFYRSFRSFARALHEERIEAAIARGAVCGGRARIPQ